MMLKLETMCLFSIAAVAFGEIGHSMLMAVRVKRHPVGVQF